MEHRYTERIASELKILIYKNSLPVAIGRVRNSSSEGVFVDTDFMDIDCEHQLQLEVLYSKKKSTKLQTFKMKALVIHKTGKGFGAEIDFKNSSHAELFVALVRENKVDVVDYEILTKIAIC